MRQRICRLLRRAIANLDTRRAGQYSPCDNLREPAATERPDGKRTMEAMMPAPDVRVARDARHAHRMGPGSAAGTQPRAAFVLQPADVVNGRLLETRR